MKRKRILIAPLDWGLGHATRCIPIIHELSARNAEVIIAADNRPAELLKKEFPDLQHIQFPGYTLEYPVNENMAWTMFRQLPTLFKGISAEHKYLNEIINSNAIDAVISDNRWGAYSKSIPSIYIVHQLRILLSDFIRWGQGIVDFENRQLIKNFNEVWIPDFASEQNLSGELSHSSRLPRNSFYIGPLSRLIKLDGMRKEMDILVILSGPEPQRSMLEEILTSQLKETSLRSLIVKGTPEKNFKLKLTENITVVSSLTSSELSQAIASAHVVISRPGYSTIMDLSFLGTNAIFIPTPQQTEQEFLAHRLKEQGICYSELQNEFSLQRALKQFNAYTGFSQLQNDYSLLQQRIDHLLKSIT
ncbi:MAG TPA: glycosyltransferase [Bacteroidetes bacterium]|nr:glycosyltransferase [Bacteroidota bacterium]